LAGFSIPRPGITRDNQFFWDGVAQRRLLIQRCARCHRLQHPPAPMCSGCQGLEMEAIEASGRGTIHSFVVAHHPPIPPFEYPNVVVLVDLEEGTRLVSRLVGVDPDDVAIGMRVTVEYEDAGDGLVLHCFRPIAGSASR
jgi:3-oxo-4,17-pregnadiene-20-carboxyl-CoA hydratase alpha subunit